MSRGQRKRLKSRVNKFASKELLEKKGEELKKKMDEDKKKRQ